MWFEWKRKAGRFQGLKENAVDSPAIATAGFTAFTARNCAAAALNSTSSSASATL
jgi:hypothetical protein